MTDVPLPEYYDEETDFHYNYHRYYDPTTGRYLTPDPIGLAGGINLFVYINGDPINDIDPSGLEGCRQLPIYRTSPSNQYNPTKAIKTSNANVQYSPGPDPTSKVLPKNFKPKGINNLPGQQMPESKNLSKNMQATKGILRAIRHIRKILGSSMLIIIIDPRYICLDDHFNPICQAFCASDPSLPWCSNCEL